MKFVANRINGVHLRDLLPHEDEVSSVDSVFAAIAYGGSASDEAYDLVGHSLNNGLRLDIWMRYDHSVPVEVSFLKRLFASQKKNVFAKFIPDCFHPKVIWWKGYGAYIGSANHTDRGWMTNIEAGVFLFDDELVANGLDAQLEDFFEYLSSIREAIPISQQYIEEMTEFSNIKRKLDDPSKDKRSHSIWDGPVFVTKQKAFDRRKENFQREWLSTLGYLQSIQELVQEYRPVWISGDVPPAWQVDQVLHAFYYMHVGEGLSKPYEEYYQRNKLNPQAALKSELEWWASLSEAPFNEDKNLYENAPLIRQLLAKDKVLQLTEEELAVLLRKTHATSDYVIKIPTAALGRPEIDSLDRETRVKLFAPLLLKQRNKQGWDIRKLLHYVLWEGKDDRVWERIYHAGRDTEYTLPRYGLNSIAEVVGWARPELAPPRNGRTSKALRALGFDVRVY